MGSISVQQLSKAYKIYPSRMARLLEWVIPWSKPRHQLHWVLEDISFRINAGEAVGIIGVNGAGKSTLLKIITGTTQATQGTATIEGHVAALLELGMGFHPDFTGRQNVFMAGQLLGLTPDEIHALIPEIESYAEIGDAIDQPVRTYSSGMQMRLAFSVATAKRPDILIVDEALSVGDAYFQHKSFDRIRKFREAGTTLLIVSHDRGAIQSICTRAFLLDKGKLVKEGIPEVVLDYYNALVAEQEQQTVRQEKLSDGSIQTISGTGEACITDIQLLNLNNERIDVVRVGQVVTLKVRVLVQQPIDRLVLGFLIKDRHGQFMYGINTHRQNQAITNLQANEVIDFIFSFEMRLGTGNYSIAFSLSRLDSHLDKNYEWRDYGLIFHVTNPHQEAFVGCNWLNASTQIQRHSLDSVNAIVPENTP